VAQLSRLSRASAHMRLDPERLIRLAIGSDVRPRPGQAEALKAIGHDSDITVCILGTGVGKTALILSQLLARPPEGRGGTTVIVSPLVALARQIRESAARAGLTAQLWTEVDDKATLSKADAVITTPEAMDSNDFQAWATDLARLRLLDRAIFDEWHMVLESVGDDDPWRTALLRATRAVQDVPRMVFFTATLPPSLEATFTSTVQRRWRTENGLRIVDGGPVEMDGGRPSLVFRQRTSRSNLCYWVEPRTDSARIVQATGAVLERVKQRLAANGLPSSRIMVYCTSTLQTGANIAAAHAANGTLVRSQSGQPESHRLVEAWIANKDDPGTLVCTSVLGAGFDCSDIRAVVVVGPVRSLIDLQQMTGRAGRDGGPAFAVVLPTSVGSPKAGSNTEQHRSSIARFTEQGEHAVCRRVTLENFIDGFSSRTRCNKMEELPCTVCSPLGQTPLRVGWQAQAEPTHDDDHRAAAFDAVPSAPKTTAGSSRHSPRVLVPCTSSARPYQGDEQHGTPPTKRPGEQAESVPVPMLTDEEFESILSGVDYLDSNGFYEQYNDHELTATIRGSSQLNGLTGVVPGLYNDADVTSASGTTFEYPSTDWRSMLSYDGDSFDARLGIAAGLPTTMTGTQLMAQSTLSQYAAPGTPAPTPGPAPYRQTSQPISQQPGKPRHFLPSLEGHTQDVATTPPPYAAMTSSRGAVAEFEQLSSSQRHAARERYAQARQPPSSSANAIPDPVRRSGQAPRPPSAAAAGARNPHAPRHGPSSTMFTTPRPATTLSTLARDIDNMLNDFGVPTHPTTFDEDRKESLPYLTIERLVMEEGADGRTCTNIAIGLKKGIQEQLTQAPNTPLCKFCIVYKPPHMIRCMGMTEPEIRRLSRICHDAKVSDRCGTSPRVFATLHRRNTDKWKNAEPIATMILSAAMTMHMRKVLACMGRLGAPAAVLQEVRDVFADGDPGKEVTRRIVSFRDVAGKSPRFCEWLVQGSGSFTAGEQSLPLLNIFALCDAVLQDLRKP
jgi:superfamily II DNA or RNA helicase